MTDPVLHRDLARVEGRLDRIEEAISALARIDERLTTLFKAMGRQQADMAALETRSQTDMRDLASRLTDLEHLTAARSPLFAWLNRIATAAIGAAVVFAFDRWR
ncbi:hypothetical protein [Paracoccus sp. (in: a-proteobacteria)]